MKPTIVGIDPGKSGGLAWSVNNGPVAAVPMPDNAHELADILCELDTEGPLVVYLEEVGGYIGGAGNTGSAMFTFGRNFGEIIGVCAAMKFPLHLVRPQVWQKALGLGNSAGMTKTQWKNKLKARAMQLYPDVKITLKNADALLIYHAATKGLI